MLNTVNANEETKQLNIQIDNFLSEIKSIRHNLLSDIIGSISILDINDANEVIKNVELLRNCNFSDYITIHQSQPSAANRFSILSEIEKAGENWRENNRSLNLNRYTFRIFSSNMSGKGSPSKDEGKGAEGYSWSVTDLQTKLMKFIDFQEKVESYPVQLDALKANVDNNTAKVDSIAVEVKHLAGVTTGISNKFDQLYTDLLQRLPVQNSNYSNAVQNLSQESFPTLPAAPTVPTQQHPPTTATTAPSYAPPPAPAAPVTRPTPQAAGPVAPPSGPGTKQKSKIQDQTASQRSSINSNVSAASQSETKMLTLEEFQNLRASITHVQDYSLDKLDPWNLHYKLRKFAAKSSKFYLFFSNPVIDKFKYADLTSMEYNDLRTRVKHVIEDNARCIILFPFCDKDYTYHADIQKSTGTAMVRSMVIDFFCGFCSMPLEVAEALEITAIKPVDSDTSFTPKSLEVVFGTQAGRDAIEPYRANMLKNRKEIIDPKYYPQMKLSVGPQMWNRFTEIQKEARRIRNANKVNPEAPEYGTKLTYNIETMLDFKLEVRDKSNAENPWVHRKDITDDVNRVLPSIWSQKNTAIQRRNKIIVAAKKTNSNNNNNSNKRKKDFSPKITPEGKKRVSTLLDHLKDDNKPSFDTALNRIRSSSSSSQSSFRENGQRGAVVLSPGLGGTSSGMVPPLPTLDAVNRNPLPAAPVDPGVLDGFEDGLGADAGGGRGAAAAAGGTEAAATTNTKQSAGRGIPLPKKCKSKIQIINQFLSDFLKINIPSDNYNKAGGHTSPIINDYSSVNGLDMMATSSPTRNQINDNDNAVIPEFNASPIPARTNSSNDSDMSFVSATDTQLVEHTIACNMVTDNSHTDTELQESDPNIEYDCNNESEPINPELLHELLRANSPEQDTHNISYLQDLQADDETVCRDWSKNNHCCKQTICICPSSSNTNKKTRQKLKSDFMKVSSEFKSSEFVIKATCQKELCKFLTNMYSNLDTNINYRSSNVLLNITSYDKFLNTYIFEAKLKHESEVQFSKFFMKFDQDQITFSGKTKSLTNKVQIASFAFRYLILDPIFSPFGDATNRNSKCPSCDQKFTHQLKKNKKGKKSICSLCHFWVHDNCLGSTQSCKSGCKLKEYEFPDKFIDQFPKIPFPAWKICRNKNDLIKKNPEILKDSTPKRQKYVKSISRNTPSSPTVPELFRRKKSNSAVTKSLVKVSTISTYQKKILISRRFQTFMTQCPSSVSPTMTAIILNLKMMIMKWIIPEISKTTRWMLKNLQRRTISNFLQLSRIQ